MVISELGVVADWAAAYTPNSGPMDAVVKVQLEKERLHSAQEHVHNLRELFAGNAWRDLEFSFDAGGMIRSAMNDGKSTPINVQITAKDVHKAHEVAQAIYKEARQVNGVVDCRVVQRLNYPQYVVEVDQGKASALGLTQVDVMQNLVAALNPSIQFNKKNFWIDPVSNNQYYVGVSYPEADIQSVQTILDIPIHGVGKKSTILGNVATLRKTTVPAEVTHKNLQTTID